MPVTAPLTVEVGENAPLHGGLLNVGKSLGFLHDVPDPHIGGGAQWENNSCGVNAFAPGVCDDALDINPETVKEFDGLGWTEAQPFALYKGIQCGLLRKDYREKTTRAFDLGEGFALEAAVDTLILKGSDDESNGVALSPNAAIALLEQIIASAGSGMGYIHVSRYGAAFLADEAAVKADSDFHLWTAQGTPIINGGGYSRTGPADEQVTGSQFWMYATGPLHVWRGPLVYSEGPGLEYNINTGLAERMYAVGAECFRVAVLVDPEPVEPEDEEVPPEEEPPPDENPEENP